MISVVNGSAFLTQQRGLDAQSSGGHAAFGEAFAAFKAIRLSETGEQPVCSKCGYPDILASIAIVMNGAKKSNRRDVV